MSFFTVIIPLYNKENFIQKTIESVLNQSFDDFEILIIEDCSTDNSKKKVLEIQSDKVKLIQHLQNKGLSASRNTGIQNANSNYVAFLDADDYWQPNFLEEMISFMKKEKAELAYSNYARCDENLNPKIADFQAVTEVTFNNLLKTCRLSLLRKPLNKTMAKYRMHPSSISRRKTNIMKDQYLVYKDYMHFSTLKSWYYTMNWAVNGFMKYSKIFN